MLISFPFFVIIYYNTIIKKITKKWKLVEKRGIDV